MVRARPWSSVDIDSDPASPCGHDEDGLGEQVLDHVEGEDSRDDLGEQERVLGIGVPGARGEVVVVRETRLGGGFVHENGQMFTARGGDTA